MCVTILLMAVSIYFECFVAFVHHNYICGRPTCVVLYMCLYCSNPSACPCLGVPVQLSHICTLSVLALTSFHMQPVSYLSVCV